MTVESAFQKRRVCELCEVTSSKRIYASDYQAEGVPFYRGKEIGEKHHGNLNVSTELCISYAKFDEMRSKFGAPVAGDLLLTSIGALLGLPYVVKQGEEFYFKDGNVTWFRNLNGLDGQFLYYWMLSPQGKGELQKSKIGSAQPAFTIGLLKQMEMELPALPTQRKIATILSAYDDLIENNLRRIKTLEVMAQNLYRDWFVKFRFPGYQHARFTDSPLGSIPVGWKVRELREFVDFERGVEPGSKNYASQLSENYVPFLRVGDLGKRESDLFVNKSFARGRILTPDDIAITMDGTVGLVRMGLEGAYSSGIRRVARKSDCPIGNAFIFQLLNSERIQAIIEAHAKGTTIKHASSSIGHMTFVLPDRIVAEAFEEYAEPINSLTLSLGTRSEALRRTRNLLLSRLISGEVDVSALDITVPEEAMT